MPASTRVLSWRLSNSLEVEFCIEALEDAMQRHGCPEIFNTLAKKNARIVWSVLSREDDYRPAQATSAV